MLIDQLMQFASNAMQSSIDALPSWQTSFDTTQIHFLVETMRAWNNWIPLDQFLICMAIAMGLWAAMVALGALVKGFELIKP